MKRPGNLEQKNLERTIELHGGDPDLMRAQHAFVTALASGAILNAIDYASTKGIGGMTTVHSILQFSAVWLHGISAPATVNALRLLADQLEAAAKGDDAAEARICEEMMINGLAFTAALDAKAKGGRN
jgi:hypothetical protein